MDRPYSTAVLGARTSHSWAWGHGDADDQHMHRLHPSPLRRHSCPATSLAPKVPMSSWTGGPFLADVYAGSLPYTLYKAATHDGDGESQVF
ncbi:hypothetical protein NDU88_001206 [Pleurodeles waltl]|uniref:Uncharacterized protein n=1 Tax=Pleurodeles waltl TaxID=8319 RepID=A0AAV7U5Q3_PLEWA|nr:hypothetical protein NDU88_001206 [Pleurodeles waltl]